MKYNTIVLPPDANGGVSITPPQGCEVDKVEVVDGVLTVTFKPQKRKLPKKWDEFYEMTGIKIPYNLDQMIKDVVKDNTTTEAILALLKLIVLRNAYNGDWVPDWSKAWFQGHKEKPNIAVRMTVELEWSDEEKGCGDGTRL